MRYLKPLVPVALMDIVAGVARAATLAVALDHASRLNVRGAANVVIGNDKVVDVTVVDSHTVYVVGKAYGSTNVIISDRDGRTLFSGDVAVNPPVASVSVYRGADRTEEACAPDCTPGQHPGQGQQSALASFVQAMSQPAPAGH